MKWGFRIAWLKDDFLIFVFINYDTGVGNIGTHVPDLDVKIPFNNTLDTVYWFNTAANGCHKVNQYLRFKNWIENKSCSKP